MNYKIHILDGIERCVFRYDETGTTIIPIDPENSDYRGYLAWVAEGNTAEAWNPQG